MSKNKGIMEAVLLETIPETGVTLHIDSSFSAKEDSTPDTNRNGSGRKRKKKKKKKEASFEEEETLDVAEKTTNDDQVHPPKNPLSNITIQEDSSQQAQDSCEKPEDGQKDSQFGAVDMTSSERKKQKRKKKKDKDRNAQRENGVDTNLYTKSKDDGADQQKGADAEADDTVSETQNLKAKKKKRRKTKTMEVCDALENTLTTSMESGAVECMETAGVCEVKSKKRKRKKKKMSSSDQENAGVESGSVECLLDHSNKEVSETCGKNVGRELVGEYGLGKTEQSATGEICGVQNPGTLKEKTKDEIGEPKQKRKKKKKKKSCELSEEVSEPKQKKKKKKKKSCEDHKDDNIDAKKDDDSVPRSEGELEFAGEKLETQLSSSVLINDNMTQGVAPQENGGLPRCSCQGQSTRKLVVFDLNGILADIARGNTGECVPDGKISFRSVFKRPFVATFLDFCFEKFDVGIWSSRRIGLDYMTDIVMGNHARNLLFSFDQSICITTDFKTLENTTKPLFLKDLRTVWNRFGTCLSCGKRKYDETNTLLVDDSPDKALCNPPHNGIFPFPYQYTDREDSALGPDGELRKYMERLVEAENVQKFVEENPIGQSAITETHESWSFYSMVIKAHKN